MQRRFRTTSGGVTCVRRRMAYDAGTVSLGEAFVRNASMKMIARLGLLWAFLGILPSVVQAQFTYTTNSGGITITKYTGSGGEVTVPDTTNGLPVTGIGDSAFRDCTTLTSITIGTNVTRMGEFAFYRSTSLTNATIPNGVTNIGYGSFGYCTRLAFVPIPDSVTSIGDYAFQYCSSLSAIAVGMSNLVYSSPGGMLYDKIQTRLIQCPGGKAGEAAIPATVTNISSDAFRGCTSLSEIIVDASNLTYCSLGGVLFDKSHSTLIQYPPGRTGAYTVPDGVTTIGDRSLYYCPNLTSLILPEGVTNIGIAAVYDCYQPAPAPPANP